MSSLKELGTWRVPFNDMPERPPPHNHLFDLDQKHFFFNLNSLLNINYRNHLYPYEDIIWILLIQFDSIQEVQNIPVK